jgi:hypothetical protein
MTYGHRAYIYNQMPLSQIWISDRIRKLKDGQHNGQKKKYKRKHKILQNITQKTND